MGYYIYAEFSAINPPYISSHMMTLEANPVNSSIIRFISKIDMKINSWISSLSISLSIRHVLPLWTEVARGAIT